MSTRPTLLHVAEQLDERYGEDRGIATLYSTYAPGQPHWEISRQTHPFTWGLGIDLQADPMPYTWTGAENWWYLCLTVGPFSLWLRRVWPARRPVESVESVESVGELAS